MSMIGLCIRDLRSITYIQFVVDKFPNHLRAEAPRSDQFDMLNLAPLVASYVAETKKLAAMPTSTEMTFYPAIKSLLTAILKDGGLPFEVRTSTSEGHG